MKCPACKIDRAHRSHRAGLAERVVRVVGVFPYECRDCKAPFLRFARTFADPVDTLTPSVRFQSPGLYSTANARGVSCYFT